MNYRHAYHAGGVADVFKHTVLIALLSHLKQKETPFHVLDTHAGSGLYDLSASESGKTGEYRNGVALLMDHAISAPLLRDYLACIHRVNPDGNLRIYPGSPVLIAGALRPQDRAAACELHPDDYATLKRTMVQGMAVHHRDGYEAMGAFLPPVEKRGLVFIDPAFEQPDELNQACQALQRACRKFPQSLYALWYPVKERPAIWRFHEYMAATGIPRQLAIEFMTSDEGDSRILNGSGMLLINPPYRLQQVLEPALQELQELIAPAGRVGFEWIVS